MRKSNFVATLLGTVSASFFALGMCMTMLPEWGAFRPGVVLGCLGILFAFITVGVWRKMEKKPAIQISGILIRNVLVGVLGCLALGVGMSFAMVWSNLILGIGIGLIGILILISMIPLCFGLK